MSVSTGHGFNLGEMEDVNHQQLDGGDHAV